MTAGDSGGLPGPVDASPGTPDADSSSPQCLHPPCTQDPCAGVFCNSPPPDTCADPNTLTVHEWNGMCQQGICSYATSSKPCFNGCAAGSCQGPSDAGSPTEGGPLGDGGPPTDGGTGGGSSCNNGHRDEGEECDTSDTGGVTCVSLNSNWNSGRLRCTSHCTLDTSVCSHVDCPATPFTVPLIPLDKIESITPLGALQPPGHTLPTTHSYLMLHTAQGAAGEGPNADGRIVPAVDVSAPGNITAVVVSRSTVHVGSGNGAGQTFSEDALTGHVCGTQYIKLGHISIVDNAINQAISAMDAAASSDRQCFSYSTGGNTYDSCNYYNLTVPITAGTVFSRSSGRAFAVDLGAWDESHVVPNKVGAGTRFLEEGGFTACAYDWYRSDVQAGFAPLFGGGVPGQIGFVARTVAPLCGRADYDLRGSAQGNWYTNASVFEQEDHLVALVPHNVDPSLFVLSVGNTGITGLPRGRYLRSGGALPANVATGQTGCMEVGPWESPSSGIGGRVVLMEVSQDATSHREVLRMSTVVAANCAAATLSMPIDAVRFER